MRVFEQTADQGRVSDRWRRSGGLGVKTIVAFLSVLAIAAVFAAAVPAAAGDLDSSFDSDGKTTTDFAGGSDDRAFDVAVQADDKIVLVGESRHANDIGYAIARYAVGGTLDPTFDADGRVRTDFGPNTLDSASSVAVQTDRKILVGGYVGGVNPGTSFDFAVARYNADGTLDPTFDGDGRVVTDIDGGRDVLTAVTLQPDGKVVVAGWSRPRGPGPHDFGVVRYNANGSLDSAFGGDGKVVTPFGADADDNATDVEVDAAGRIVVSGWTFTPGRDPDFAIARYSPDGNLDLSFDGDGRVVIGSAPAAANYGSDLAIQRDGKLVIVGTPDFTVARLNLDGSLDTSFGSNGFASDQFEGAGAQAWSVAVQRDGKIVVGGNTLGPSNDFALARFTPRGVIDTSFSGDGRVVTDVAGPTVGDVPYGIAIDRKGRIVLGGLSGPPGSLAEGAYDFAVARYVGALPCLVPKLKGTTLQAARSRLAKARCTLGRVKRAYSRKVKKGRVVSQTPRSGKQLPERGKISIVVSRGRRR
jgi:uncharacterized delta-60 repeat protein